MSVAAGPSHLSSLEATLSAKLVLAGGGGRSERDRDVQQARAGLKAECRRLMIDHPGEFFLSPRHDG